MSGIPTTFRFSLKKIVKNAKLFENELLIDEFYSYNCHVRVRCVGKLFEFRLKINFEF